MSGPRPSAIERAQAALQAKREAGQPIRRSLAKPLREYFLDLAGVYLNQGCRDAPIREMRAEACANYEAARKKGLAAAVQRICYECQGGDADPGPKIRVRDCTIEQCPLHPVRPWQQVKGRR